MGEILTALAQLGKREYLGIVEISSSSTSWAGLTGWNPQTNFAVLISNSATGEITDLVSGNGFTLPASLEIYSSTFFSRTRPSLSGGAASLIMYKQYV
jgi:hypothetical protein